MNSKRPVFGTRVRALVAATLTILVTGACRSGDTARTGREPWTKQTRRETERHWWFQNRYDDSRPSALNPAEHP